jgi:hypothetical protein
MASPLLFVVAVARVLTAGTFLGVLPTTISIRVQVRDNKINPLLPSVDLFPRPLCLPT